MLLTTYCFNLSFIALVLIEIRVGKGCNKEAKSDANMSQKVPQCNTSTYSHQGEGVK